MFDMYTKQNVSPVKMYQVYLNKLNSFVNVIFNKLFQYSQFYSAMPAVEKNPSTYSFSFYLNVKQIATLQCCVVTKTH